MSPRTVDVSLVFLRVPLNERSYFLQQWDADAGQYQMIGGRIEANESPIDAARRELGEELVSTPDGRFELTPLTQQPLELTATSPTLGVATAYRFWIFGSVLLEGAIFVGPSERWIDRAALLQSPDDAESERLYRSIDAGIPNGLDGIPASISPSQVRGALPQ